MKKQNGFTLIELMVTVASAMIVLTVGTPNLRGILQDNQTTTIANEFVSAVNFARLVAVQRSREVRLSAVNPTDANEWGAGWRIWIDANNNNAYDAGEELRVRSTLEGDATFDSAQNVSEIRFLASGFTNIPQIHDFTLRLPGCQGDQGRAITVTPTSSARVAHMTCS
jgi:type IV fimbrial biogenesis protein FimT